MGPASPRALVVVGLFGPSVARMLAARGFAVELQDPRSFRSLDEPGRRADLLVTDLHAEGGSGGVDLANRLRDLNPRLPVVFLADHLESRDIERLDRELPGCPTLRSPPNSRQLAMAIAAARSPTAVASPARPAAASMDRRPAPETRPHA